MTRGSRRSTPNSTLAPRSWPRHTTRSRPRIGRIGELEANLVGTGEGAERGARRPAESNLRGSKPGEPAVQRQRRADTARGKLADYESKLARSEAALAAANDDFANRAERARHRAGSRQPRARQMDGRSRLTRARERCSGGRAGTNRRNRESLLGVSEGRPRDERAPSGSLRRLGPDLDRVCQLLPRAKGVSASSNRPCATRSECVSRRSG